jgi:hypothetical protein
VLSLRRLGEFLGVGAVAVGVSAGSAREGVEVVVNHMGAPFCYGFTFCHGSTFRHDFTV